MTCWCFSRVGQIRLRRVRPTWAGLGPILRRWTSRLMTWLAEARPTSRRCGTVPRSSFARLGTPNLCDQWCARGRDNPIRMWKESWQLGVGDTLEVAVKRFARFTFSNSPEYRAHPRRRSVFQPDWMLRLWLLPHRILIDSQSRE